MLSSHTLQAYIHLKKQTRRYLLIRFFSASDQPSQADHNQEATWMMALEQTIHQKILRMLHHHPNHQQLQ
jgi:hypothetical protein